MSERVCELKDCTISQTGVCLRSYPNVTDCPHHVTSKLTAELETALATNSPAAEDERHRENVEPIDALPGTAASVGEAVLDSPEDRSSLPRSNTLGLAEANALMATRYVSLVGIVGLPDAGKTACIASLYLLLSHRALKGFSYLRSKTLMALEEISRGARRWNEGNAPAQMTSHTEMLNDRQAGFLHLRLRRSDDGRKFDLLLPDLPGEWSKSLIDSNDADRLSFLSAADTIWLLVDGRSFQSERTRRLSAHRAKLLIERLASLLCPRRPRIILVASWRDEGAFPPLALSEIQECGARFDFTIELCEIASFSIVPDIQPGCGMHELIATTLNQVPSRPDPWPESAPGSSARAFLRFRSEP
ncbi:hypothetical protein SAMN05444679_103121 [Variovorax sp. CF079]|uniref:TRAFAC clade GTPase domain-containing protein n=1 Tax=Variovorax sp. CF079 TaxID=1882774 RepID=UPI000883F998|nr:hypothetical protein [Variovorax sp. CF079]SDC45861.1 hypothetical protein SAMN05444679_103121 [Variovorax sp. CF079]